MRLHSLEITAFGPFAGTHSVDFEELTDAGIFLLCGPTGAGKTSVLDAVCFALYGDVPGDRSAAKRLRSDLAEPGVEPRVMLEATLRGRRLRITRSPQWTRPKRRGTGLTTQHAHVLVEELTAAGPQQLTHRLDEAGHLVSGLLGLTLSQFCQVVMLPQGRFQAFLRSGPDERQRLLQHLFRTSRFEDMEQWLREHRAGLRRTAQEHEARIAGLGHRLSEVTGADFATFCDPQAEFPYADAVAGPLQQAATEHAEHATGLAQHLREQLQMAGAEVAQAIRAVEQALALHQDQQRYAAAEQAWQAAAEAEPAVAELADLVARHERAAPLLGLGDELARLQRESAAAQQRWQAAQTATPDLEDDEVASRLAHARERLVRAETLREVDAERAETASALQAAAAELSSITERLAGLTERRDALPSQLLELARVIADLDEAATRLAAHEVALAKATEQRQAHERIGHLTLELEQARTQLRAAIDVHHRCKEHWHELRERRLDEMASELARDLAVGESCPVCGSCSHPQPAPSSLFSVTADDERAARAEVDNAEVTRFAHEDQVRLLDQTLAGAVVSTDGVSAAAAAAAQIAAERAITECRQLLTRRDRVHSDQRRLESELARLSEQVQDTQIAQAALTERHTALAERCAGLSATLTDFLGAASGLDELIEHTRAEERCLVQRRDAHRAALDVAQRVTALTETLTQRAAELGFADLAELAAAHLPESDLAAHREAITAHAEARAAARSTLADPVLISAQGTPRPDIESLRALAEAADQTRIDTENRHHRATETAGRMEALRRQVEAAVLAWQPLGEQLALATRVSSFVEGKAADNVWQMRLSAYVLSWRLGQVVAAANARLDRMTDQRFALEHSVAKTGRDRRGGLSLLVHDTWSGELRDPMTLSGGETFLVALALALGLTDVVTAEAGGAELGILFVDEGFGMLDAATLDDVMDTLDSLREGGRAVGVVSHVAELQDRIHTQLHVLKERRGSTVRVSV